MGWLRRAVVGLGAALAVAACSSSGSTGEAASTPDAPFTIAVAPMGRATAAQLQQIYRIIGSRLRSLHVGSANLVGNHILITAPTSKSSLAEQLATEPGRLQFRQVLAAHRDAKLTAQPTVSRATAVTPELLTSLANWNCLTDADPTNGMPANDVLLACNQKKSRVYLLAPTSLDGHDVRSASVGLDPQDGGTWVVNLRFNHRGAGSWRSLTRQSYEATGSAVSGYFGCAPPSGCNAIGVVLDGVLESAPSTEIAGIPGGRTVISGNFSRAAAEALEAVLRSGSLPLPVHLVS